jgi:hypothetical protein
VGFRIHNPVRRPLGSLKICSLKLPAHSAASIFSVANKYDQGARGIGAFYEIDSELNITLLADVMNEPGHRYALLYGLADPTFPKNSPFSRFSDAGKLMALASFSVRSTLSIPQSEEPRVALSRLSVIRVVECLPTTQRKRSAHQNHLFLADANLTLSA